MTARTEQRLTAALESSTNRHDSEDGAVENRDLTQPITFQNRRRSSRFDGDGKPFFGNRVRVGRKA